MDHNKNRNKMAMCSECLKVMRRDDLSGHMKIHTKKAINENQHISNVEQLIRDNKMCNENMV